MKQKKFTGVKGFTTADTEYRYEVTDKTPAGAPNVVYIVLDDLGFAQLGCYGSDIHTPHIDRLAKEGLRYNNFHTTAICSATRASLLTGMNHHTAGICAIVEMTTGCENGIGHLHKDCATLAEILKEYDYGTYAVGKWHLANVTETTEAGPYDNWPLGKGFDKYYGFLHAQMDQFHPRLVRDNSPAEQPKTPEEGYHFSEDITDNAIKYVYHQHVAYPEKPFFLYVAYGAMHTPHHAPKEYIDKYKGKFDEGWDVKREKWFARQKELGVIPQDAKLTERNEMVQAWDDLNGKQKKLAARYMEAYAGMLEHTDAQIGRLLDFLEEIGELDNTVVVFLSDNGASGEGGQDGMFDQFRRLDPDDDAGREAELDYALAHIDEIGTPKAYNHYPIGWANAGNTPFPWYKTFAYCGGVKDPMIVRYPKLIKDAGGIRSQYHHVSDITPTMLDIIGVKKPEFIKGVHQRPFQGTSFKYTLANPDAPDQKRVQYYEMMGNRAIYKDGWKAIVNHARNGSLGESYEDDVWELYHVEKDYSEYENVAEQYPKKVEEMEREWLIEAARAGVFPMHNGCMYGSAKANRQLHECAPQEEESFETYTNILEPFDLVRGMSTGLSTKSHVMRVRFTRESQNEQGAIFTLGNLHGGFVLYVKDNRLRYTYNCANHYFYNAVSERELPAGSVDVEYRFKRKGNSAHVQLFVEGKKEAEVEITALNFGTDWITSVGINKNTAVAPQEYEAPFAFEGKLDQVSILVDGKSSALEEEIEAFFRAD